MFAIKFLSASVIKLNLLQGRSGIPMHTKITHTRLVRSKLRNTKPSVVRRLSKDAICNTQASFDVRDLYVRFQNISWASDFPLERFTIGEIHTYDIVKNSEVIGRGSPEIANVPLPGIECLETEPELQDVAYIKSRRLFL